MINNIQDSDLAKEILMIIPYVDNYYLKLLSQEFINSLTCLASNSTKNYNFDISVGFDNINLSEECKDFLAMLYYSKLDDKNKYNLYNIWKQNEY